MAAETLTRGERTRLAILEAAHELFIENGYGGTSMRQIAERAGGIAVGGIYNHFGSKQELLAELLRVESPTSLMIASLEEAQGNTAPELLADALRRMTAYAADEVDFLQLAYIDIQKFDAAAMTEIVQEIVPRAMAFGQRVQQAGGLRAEVDPLMMMRIFASLLIGFALTERIVFRDGQPRIDSIPGASPEQWIDAFVDVLLHGVAQAEG